MEGGIAVAGTLLGVVVGALLNYVMLRKVKSLEWRLALARDQSTFRQKLYAEFLVTAQQLVSMSRDDRVTSLRDLDPLNAKFAEVSLVGPEKVVNAARQLADYALTSQTAPPAKEVRDFYKLKEQFISAVREDISAVLSAV